MKKIVLLLLVSIPLSIGVLTDSIFAQNAEKDLESAVKIYNALQEYTSNLSDPKDVTTEVLNSVKKRVKDGTALLDKVIDSGTADQIKTARYFKVNFRYKQGFVYGTKGDNNTSFKEINALREEYESYSDAAKFPLRYKLEDKNFIIKYDDFAPTLAQYYMATSELAANLNKSEMQYEYAKKTYNFPKADAWYRFLASTQIVDYFKDKKQYDSELAQTALDQIKIYINELTDNDKKTLEKINYPSPLSISKTIKTVLETKPDFTNNASICGETAKILTKLEGRDDIIILQFYEAAVKGDKYLTEALDFARTRKDGNNIVSPFPTNSSRFKLLGISVLDKNASKISDTNCDDLKKYADDYNGFGEANKGKSFMARYNKCAENKKKEEERRVAQQKAEEARRERERRRANRELHIYAGVNVLPLLSKPADIGGVLNFGAKNTLVEVSYLKVTKKKENFFDLSLRDISDPQEHKWDGYFAHVALKFGTKGSNKKSKIYVGPLLGYNVRTFEKFTSNVLNTTNNRTSPISFAPTSKQYIGMLNMGMLALSGLAGDMYFGIGAAYNQFDGGNNDYWNKDTYTIEDKMLANRKTNYYSFTMRIGVSIGIGK
jgi:hypothetical protein